ncbi:MULTISPECIES: hypothetical protein [Vibrio]|uniref:hypothetical protein n=1 Tax=Vibrio TaxID=662 RepID=UPI00038E5167|nr:MULTISPECIES: hypothetical protein [Vibrio]RFD48413.1 hypothetical protein H328_000245 [Vibrio parahaemolyticus 3355]EGQ9150454.1 hypothetical protein [Vibrio parahaemolyticus]EGR0986892.1 hypothetical protein [Vibrio parahaemolyticus]EGR1373106.1 hypothetical protein [Vibrio parahaemolyticus]ELN3183502.1 hypothetical protein [Vibrio cholerae]
MTDNTAMEALFIQQRLQIMNLGVHHNEFSDSYLHAWESGTYPLLQDTDGSVIRMPHEPYAEFFKTPKDKVQRLFDRLCTAWDAKEELTFYALEDELGVRGGYGSEWDRVDLIKICRYLYLERSFDEEFWKTLITPMEHPSEASSILREFNRERDIYFM